LNSPLLRQFQTVHEAPSPMRWCVCSLYVIAGGELAGGGAFWRCELISERSDQVERMRKCRLLLVTGGALG
jgi:hypothetical protein